MTPSSTTPLMGLAEFGLTTDARAPLADVTNARYLFGDPYDESFSEPFGDAAYGDAAYGDVNSIGLADVGDPSSAGLDTYSTLVGAPVPSWVKYAGVGLAGAAAGYTVKSLIEQKRRRDLQRALVQQQLANAAGKNTIANSVLARRLMGKIPLNTPFQFYSVQGANLNQYPLAPTEVFPADSLKYNLDRQASDTPFEVEIANGVVSGSNLVATAPGVANNRYFGGIIVTVGINALAANPGTVMTVTASIPTIAGTLTISANPFSFTFGRGWYAKFIIYPWQLVTNKPVLVLGQYNTVNPIVVTVAGVPTSSSVTLVVPGSMHQWTIAMRNRLVIN